MLSRLIVIWMETNKGGWTLAWSYSFTHYSHFSDGSNAINPDVPDSTNPPLNETDFNAMNFPLLKQLGRQALINSNINNWLVCRSENGSLVDWQKGDVNCTIIEYVADPSKLSLAPSRFLAKTNYGPMFYLSGRWNSTSYYFNSYTGKNWPTHDPLGRNKANQKKNVVDPHGNILIRAK